MKQNLKTIHEICEQIKQWGEAPQVQKIFSTGRYVCIVMRYRGNTKHLYLGRGEGFEGLFTGKRPPPSELRIRDQFLEYLRKNLIPARIIEFSCSSSDRVFFIDYFKWGEKNTIAFFWCGPKLYFCNHYYVENEKKYKLFCSWKSQHVFSENDSASVIVNAFKEVGYSEQMVSSSSSEASIIDMEKLLEEEKGQQKSKRTKKRKLRFFKNKIANIEKDLEKVSKWKQLQDYAKAMQETELPGGKLNILGVNFKFPYGNSFYENRDRLFLKIKAFKKAQDALSKRLEETKRSFERFDINKQELDIKVIRPIWAEVKSSKASSNTDGSYKIFELPGNIKGAVGIDKNGNDSMRINWAKKSDLWFHIESGPSSHLIVKVDNIGQLDESNLSLIGSIILHYSKKEIGEVSLIYTNVKHLKGVKGTPGMVTYKKQKYLKVLKDNKWQEKVIFL